MINNDNAQSPVQSCKQAISLPHIAYQQHQDLLSYRDSYSSEQSLQTNPQIQYSQQQQYSNNCLDQLKLQVDTIIPRKKGKRVTRPFSRKEDELILLLVDQFGPKFLKLVKFFSGRQATILKNRYYKFLRTEYLRDKEYSAKDQKMTERRGKQIRNNIEWNPCVGQQQEIRQCLDRLDCNQENKNIMGKCIDNLFTLFQNMYQ